MGRTQLYFSFFVPLEDACHNFINFLYSSFCVASGRLPVLWKDNDENKIKKNKHSKQG